MLLSFALLMLAAFAAGVVNAVAGGGAFLTFPALVFAGVPPLAANASSTVALFPGQGASAWTYRRDIASITQVNVPAFVGVSLVGGLLGALLLLFTSNEAFAKLVPFLMLFATLVFGWGNFAGPAALKRYSLGPTAVLVVQFLISIYGGYFGGGIGFLMLAALTLFGLRDIHAMNGLKILLATLMNGAAVVAFAGAGIVHWPETLAMMAAGIVGGVLGAKGAKKVSPKVVKMAVLSLGVALTIVFFWKQYGAAA